MRWGGSISFTLCSVLVVGCPDPGPSDGDVLDTGTEPDVLSDPSVDPSPTPDAPVDVSDEETELVDTAADTVADQAQDRDDVEVAHDPDTAGDSQTDDPDQTDDDSDAEAETSDLDDGLELSPCEPSGVSCDEGDDADGPCRIVLNRDSSTCTTQTAPTDADTPVVSINTATGDGVAQRLYVLSATNAEWQHGAAAYSLLSNIQDAVPVTLEMVDADTSESVCVQFTMHADTDSISDVSTGCW